MLGEANNPVLQIVSVEKAFWNGGTFKVKAREYSALTFRISGSAVITSGEKEYRIQSGDVLYLPQGMDYTAKYTDTEVLIIHFITAENDREIQVFSPPNTEKIYKLFLTTQNVWENKSPAVFPFTLGNLYTVIATLLEAETHTALPPHFSKAVSLIHANFCQSTLNVPEICLEAGIGKTAFRQFFKKYYRKTPTEYITDLRIENARNLIACGRSVESAAIESGFTDPKYFARVVKKRFGCTPRAFKSYGK